MFLRCFMAVAAALMLFPVSLQAQNKPKYLFLLIGDGMGPNIVKVYRGQMGKTSFDKLGEPIETGTNNVFGKTTDSAASGTALACGIKTYNGAIGVDKDGVPVMSLAKILKKRGMKVGIISSVAINDATPGTHFANRISRKDAAGTLSDLLVSDFDFFGVSNIMRPKELTDEHLAFILKRNRFSVYEKNSFDKMKKGDKNLFRASTIAYRGKTTPSLADVTSKAIELLDNPNGFFMMVEGGAIDGMNHRNESAMMIREMSAFDEVISVALNFAEKHPEDTLIVVTADHDTGGLQIKGDVPADFWKKQSVHYADIDKKLTRMRKEKKSREEMIAYVCKCVSLTGVSEEEQKRIEAAADRFISGKQTEKGSMYGKYNPLIIEVFKVRDARNNLAYTTFGHTPTKVLTFSVGNGKKYFTAPLENSDIPRRISLAATGEDLLEKYKGIRPFPEAQNDFHFTVQSVDSDSIVCRYNLGDAKDLKVTISGKDKNESLVLDKPFGRFTFKNLVPASDYTVSAGNVTVKVKTPEKLENITVKGAIISDPHLSVLPDNPRQRLHSRSAKMIGEIKKNLDKANINVLLVPGDVTDKSMANDFKIFSDTFKKVNYKVLATAGNHDISNRKNAREFKKAIPKPSSYCDINGIQFVTLNTWNGKLNNPGNAEVIAKLDVARPAVIQSHFQLKKSNDIIKDSNSAIKDTDDPEVKKMLGKIANSRSVVFVGHKNAAEKVVIGDKVVQINCPQMTQYPCGYLMFEANNTAISVKYVPAADAAIEEYSRRLAPYQKREEKALEYWNCVYPWPAAR